MYARFSMQNFSLTGIQLIECTSKFRSRVVEAARVAVKAHIITPMITKRLTEGMGLHDSSFQAEMGADIRRNIDESGFIYQVSIQPRYQ
jgi:hypothetical protein